MRFYKDYKDEAPKVEDYYLCVIEHNGNYRYEIFYYLMELNVFVVDIYSTYEVKGVVAWAEIPKYI